MTTTENMYLTIDMERWPDAWRDIKSKLAKPESHFENGWISDLFNWIDSNDPDITYVSYEISSLYTTDGIPKHVDIPVKWEPCS